MAEIAIPILALGSLYIASNQKDNKQNIEGLATRDPALTLPNTNIPAVNFPVYKPDTASDINNYPNANQVTDKYFNQAVLQNNVKKNQAEILMKDQKSLTGEPINIQAFTHNNMVPYFGGKLKGNAYMDKIPDESMLDSMIGTGSQQIRKREQAPMFKPQENTQYTYGVPNQSDFYQSRVNPSMRINNVTPFDSNQNVGPGLNEGFNTQGSGGYNAGMESRDSWLPKTVNEMRVATNPKITFGLAGHEGPVGVGNGTGNTGRAPDASTQGRVEKNRPDRYFINSPDRYFTTGGLEKGQTSRPLEIDRFVNRATTNSEHMNPGGNHNGSRVPENYRAPHVKQLDAPPLGSVTMEGGNNIFGRDSMDTINNRMVDTGNQRNNPVSGVMGAVVAPLLDLLRPTKKQNVVGSIRPYGNAQSPIAGGKPMVVDPNDRTPVTTKETTVFSPFATGARAFNDDRSKGGYLSNPNQAIFNQRDTTNIAYGGTAGPGRNGNATVYNAAYAATTTSNRSQNDRPNQGGMALLNDSINQTTHRLDTDRNSTGWASPYGASTTPTVQTMGRVHMPQSYDNINSDRMNPDILQAFKNNPYTQSLQSYA